jgi:hypothetical protein
MRPLRYSINVTLDGCCDHRAMFADEDLHRHAVENLDRADALLFGRVTPAESDLTRKSTSLVLGLVSNGELETHLMEESRCHFSWMSTTTSKD